METQKEQESTRTFDYKLARETISNLYNSIKGMWDTNKFDKEKFIELIKNGLTINAADTAAILLYVADSKGLNKQEWVAPIIQIIAESESIGTKFRVRFFKGLTKINCWKLAVSFLNYKSNATFRMNIFLTISREIKNKNVSCLRELPRQGVVANRIRGFMGYEPKKWRKLLARSCWWQLATMMSTIRWNLIDYTKLPTCLLVRYYNAFMRHDKDRFNAYLSDKNSKGFIVNKIKASPIKMEMYTLTSIIKNYKSIFLEDIKGDKHGTPNHDRRTRSFTRTDKKESRSFKEQPRTQVHRRITSNPKY